MKKVFVAIAMMGCIVTSCNKEETPEPQKKSTPQATTNAVQGDWNITVYDGMTVSSPMVGTYKATATSATGGKVHFDLSFDGSSHKTEDASYTLSNNDKNIVFTKTGGDFNVLSGGGTWVVEELTANAFSIKSANGLVIKMAK